jgi:hypothetical protein
MSLCGTCGLDLESGQRIDVTEDLAMPTISRREAPPIGAWIVGGMSIFVGSLFALISMIQWQREDQWGYLMLLPVCLFGVYAAVQFLRGKSLKLLIIALTLGVAVNVVTMIILPVVMVLADVDVQTKEGEEAPAIASANDRLDTTKIAWGVALIVGYVAVALYLNSPQVRRRFR